MSEAFVGDWLLVDIDGEIANFGLVTPSLNPSVHNVKSYKTADFPTATDCFNRYASDIGIRLKDRKCGLSVSGAVDGDGIKVQRCRWIISISGIGYLTGIRPLVINDSIAKSWVNLGASAAFFSKIGGHGNCDFTSEGRWVTINYHRGLGGAVLQRIGDDGIFATESECGHIAFAPQDDMEYRLSVELARMSGRATYENILFLGKDDAIWSNLGQDVTDGQRDSIRAGILGSFAGDMALAFAGWSGLFLHGDQCQFLGRPEFATIFNQRFENKGQFRTNVSKIPRYLGKKETTNLSGLAQMMVARNYAG